VPCSLFKPVPIQTVMKIVKKYDSPVMADEDYPQAEAILL